MYVCDGLFAELLIQGHVVVVGEFHCCLFDLKVMKAQSDVPVMTFLFGGGDATAAVAVVVAVAIEP